MSGCEAMPQRSGFISGVTTYLDCQAQMLGSGAWDALAAPGSTLETLLVAFLTIFVGLIGYELLFGTAMTVRRGTRNVFRADIRGCTGAIFNDDALVEQRLETGAQQSRENVGAAARHGGHDDAHGLYREGAFRGGSSERQKTEAGKNAREGKRHGHRLRVQPAGSADPSAAYGRRIGNKKARMLTSP